MVSTAAEWKLTFDDYAAFPDDGRRWELLDGEAYLTPAPNTRHQDVVLRIVTRFSVHTDEHGGGRVFVAPYDVVLSEHDVVEPDVVFVADEDAHRITEANLQGPPTLAVEVLSDPRHDLVRKRKLYAHFGVPEYWVVDPRADRVEVYRLADGAYGLPALHEPGMELTYDRLPGLRIDVTALFA